MKDVADEDDQAPDLDRSIDSSEPHVYEILDVIDLPPGSASTGRPTRRGWRHEKDLAAVELGGDLPEAGVACYEFGDVCGAHAARERGVQGA